MQRATNRRSRLRSDWPQSSPKKETGSGLDRIGTPLRSCVYAFMRLPFEGRQPEFRVYERTNEPSGDLLSPFVLSRLCVGGCVCDCSKPELTRRSTGERDG